MQYIIHFYKIFSNILNEFEIHFKIIKSKIDSDLRTVRNSKIANMLPWDTSPIFINNSRHLAIMLIGKYATLPNFQWGGIRL